MISGPIPSPASRTIRLDPGTAADRTGSALVTPRSPRSVTDGAVTRVAGAGREVLAADRMARVPQAHPLERGRMRSVRATTGPGGARAAGDHARRLWRARRADQEGDVVAAIHGPVIDIPQSHP